MVHSRQKAAEKIHDVAAELLDVYAQKGFAFQYDRNEYQKFAATFPFEETLDQNMAMNGIRDMSIISTPPARRLTIKTFVRQADDLLIREAILREILRGGQAYYLHNDVASIENCAEKLTAFVPETRIIVGHRQMRERELERVMPDFYHRRFNVLVCSTIIEPISTYRRQILSSSNGRIISVWRNCTNYAKG